MRDDTHLLAAMGRLNAEYARAIDDDRLECWPAFFAEECLYSITSRENIADGMEAGIIYADSGGMLRDRVSALRQANIYEPQRYRHIIGPASITAHDGDAFSAESPFAVYRIMHDGRTDIFATGIYRDVLQVAAEGGLKLRERVVICDSSVFDTLLAVPL